MISTVVKCNFLLSLLTLLSQPQNIICSTKPNHLVHAFYYLWYGTPEIDGRFLHWNHEILPHWNEQTRQKFPHGRRHQAPHEIHSPFYPERGLYSSNDPIVVRRQMLELQASKVNVVVLSWWGRREVEGTTDTQGVSTDITVGTIIKVIESIPNMQFSFHMEPYPGRSVDSFRQDVVSLTSRYGTSSSWFRINDRRTYYIYDSYHIPSKQWRAILSKNDDGGTLRGTDDDGFFIGLWLDRNGGHEAKSSGFDGTYSYFGSDGFTYGSTTSNWQAMSKFSTENQMIFIPSVGPGYNDVGIRPWNSKNTKGRGGSGEYYDYMWRKALEIESGEERSMHRSIRSGAASSQYVTITSYNEWGEGTQIEPASLNTNVESLASFEGRKNKKYLEYPNDEWFFMNRTKYWSEKWNENFKEKKGMLNNVDL